MMLRDRVNKTGDTSQNLPPQGGVKGWLWCVYLMIFAMVIVGGITRLTGSGLSMVDWRPLMGTLPPLSEAAWQESFDAYRQSPQFRLENSWMHLSDYQGIFFWEYLHRLLGRTLGLVVFIPWIAFMWRRKLNRKLARRCAAFLLLGGLQGLLGWFMVKSGLVHRPEVSHYRLASHLSLAFLIGAMVFWTLLGLDAEPSQPGQRSSPRLRALSWTLLAALALQVVYGAFMAGTHAGLLYPSFPDMNGDWWPPGILNLQPPLRNIVDNPIAIHFTHRLLAGIILLIAALIGVEARKSELLPAQRRSFIALLACLTLQIIAGALTVLWSVPTWMAATHQALAYILVSAALWWTHQLYHQRSKVDAT